MQEQLYFCAMSEKQKLRISQQMIDVDLAEGKNDGRVHTASSEPNGHRDRSRQGYLYKLCFAEEFGGKTNLRFDDTNPVKEDVEYVDAIRDSGLGFTPNGGEFFTSDYFDQLYDFAHKLIDEGKAYVDDQTSEQIAEQKGTPTEPGTQSPFRARTVAETRSYLER